MPSRIPDIAVPPRCREMIRAGALVAINTSGGKDSQAMTILLSRIVPAGQLVTVHAPLPDLTGIPVTSHSPFDSPPCLRARPRRSSERDLSDSCRTRLRRAPLRME